MTDSPGQYRYSPLVPLLGIAIAFVMTSCSPSVSHEGAGTHVGGTFHLPDDVSLEGQLVGHVFQLTDGRIVGFEHRGDVEDRALALLGYEPGALTLVVRQSITATENLDSYRGPEIDRRLLGSGTDIKLVADRWIIWLISGGFFWWDIESGLDTPRHFEYPDTFTRPWGRNAAPLTENLFNVSDPIADANYVVELDTGEAWPAGTDDWELIETKVPGLQWLPTWETGTWIRALGDGNSAYTYNNSFTDEYSYDFETGWREDIGDGRGLGGGGLWFEGDEKARIAERIGVVHPALDPEVVWFDLSREIGLQGLINRGDKVALTSEGHIVINVDDQLMIWTADDGKVVDVKVSEAIHSIHPIREGPIVIVYRSGDITTWDLGGTEPIATEQFATGWTLPEGEWGIAHVLITDDNHVVLTWNHVRDRSHIEGELQIVELAD